jgi:hypothetical protein
MRFDRSRCFVLTLFLTAAFSAFVAGCGGGGIERVEVSGTITLDGKPVESGSVLLIPLQDGPTAGRAFTGGEFHIAESDGPSPGPYRVEITAFRGTGDMIPDGDFPDQLEERQEQYIPPRYNDQSELEVQVSAEGENHWDFELKSQ